MAFAGDPLTADFNAQSRAGGRRLPPGSRNAWIAPYGTIQAPSFHLGYSEIDAIPPPALRLPMPRADANWARALTEFWRRSLPTAQCWRYAGGWPTGG